MNKFDLEIYQENAGATHPNTLKDLCFFLYCNAHDDLKTQLCNGAICRTGQQLSKCKAHWDVNYAPGTGTLQLDGSCGSHAEGCSRMLACRSGDLVAASAMALPPPGDPGGPQGRGPSASDAETLFYTVKKLPKSPKQDKRLEATALAHAEV